MLLRIGLHHLDLLASGIEQRQRYQVCIALVGEHVDALVVGVKPHRAAGFKHVARIHLGEFVGVDAQDLGVAVVGRARCQAQDTLVVEIPARQAIGILAQQRTFASGDLHLVEVVPGLVAIVQAHEKRVGIGPRHRVDHGTSALGIREIARRGNFRSGRHTVGGIHRVHVEILVPGLVLHEQNVFAVLAPEVLADGTLGVIRDGFGFVEGLFGLLHPDIAGSCSEV